MNDLSHYIMSRRPTTSWVAPTTRLADGAKLSIQASKYHYCTPRQNQPDDGWTSFEVYCPVGLTEDELKLIFGDNDPEDEPAGYVSVEVLEQIIANHGGLV